MNIAESLAEYVHSMRYSDIDSTTLGSAKSLVVDTLGCAIGAVKEGPVEIAAKTVQDTAGPCRATILGTGRKVDPEMAAFVNGGAARYFDYNDAYDGKEFGHPSDNILPILAVAESERKGGKDAILGIVLAYELQARLADAATLWKRGWDHVIYGLVSVSAAASKMMGLSTEQTANAIDIALNSHLVMRQLRAGEISMWKAMAFSNAARNAILAARLAGNGMTGPSPVFEGEMGFFKQVTGGFRLDTSGFGGMKGGFRINYHVLKYFPAEVRAQAAIFAALELRKSIGRLEDIASVTVGAGDATYKVIGSEPEKWDPRTKETADHSMPYIVAAALMDGKIDTRTFAPKRFRDAKTLEFMKRIKVKSVPSYTAMFAEGGTSNPASIEIRMRDGRKLYKEVLYSRGHWKNPMTRGEIEGKFTRLTAKRMDARKSAKVLGMAWGIDKIDDIGKLFGAIGTL